MRWIVIIALLLAGCPYGYGGRLFASVTAYKIRESTSWPRTAKGVRVANSTPAQRAEVDKRIDELEACLGKPIKRDWLSIYIATDSTVSPCTGQQLLPYPAPDRLCIAKGVTPTAECPCRWRSAIQDGYYVIVTPDLRMLKQEVARLVLSINNPWRVPPVARCL